MRFVSLFAGVGGFDLGLERSGHTCVGQVEIDKHAQSVLARHWPNVPRHDDVTTAIDWADEIGLTGNVDLVAGGFPCQDVSVAGQRAGLAGERSGLFYDALAFAKAVKAKTILLENVPGLLSSNQGRDFGTILTELAIAGYSNIEWRVLDSQFFGVPQRRKRIFIIANTGDQEFRAVLSEPESMSRNPKQGDQAWEGSLPTGILPRLIRNYSFEYMVGDKYSFVSIPLSVVKVTYRSDSIIERSVEVSDSSTFR